MLCLALLLLVFFAGEAMAFIYAIFALMAGLLFGLLGRLKVIEYLVAGVSAALMAVTTAVLLYFFGSWSAMLQEFRQSITQQIELAARMHEKMGFPADSLELLKERAPHMIEMVLQLLPALVFLSLAFMVLINIMFLCRRFPERRAQWLSLTNLRDGKAPSLWFGF